MTTPAAPAEPPDAACDCPFAAPVAPPPLGKPTDPGLVPVTEVLTLPPLKSDAPPPPPIPVAATPQAAPFCPARPDRLMSPPLPIPGAAFAAVMKVSPLGPVPLLPAPPVAEQCAPNELVPPVPPVDAPLAPAVPAAPTVTVSVAPSDAAAIYFIEAPPLAAPAAADA